MKGVRCGRESGTTEVYNEDLIEVLPFNLTGGAASSFLGHFLIVYLSEKPTFAPT